MRLFQLLYSVMPFLVLLNLTAKPQNQLKSIYKQLERQYELTHQKQRFLKLLQCQVNNYTRAYEDTILRLPVDEWPIYAPEIQTVQQFIYDAYSTQVGG